MWKLGDVRIFTQKNSNAGPQKNIVVLQPLNGGSVYQTFGYKKSVFNIGGKVVGFTDKETLESYSREGTLVTLSGYGKSYGNFLINSIKFDMDSSICQTIRPDLPEDTPVFSFEAELFSND